MSNVRIHKKVFGLTRDGRKVDLIILEKETIRCQLLTYGAALQSLSVPGRDGPTDVILGFDTVEGYEIQDKFMGAIVGRYANRIAAGHFFLNGKEYKLECNDGANHLHGGSLGFDKKIWDVQEIEDGLVFRYESADGEAGYPGKLTVQVTYQLQNQELRIRYRAVSDAPTICNLTCHAYWNLHGHDRSDAMSQFLTLYADNYTPVRPGSIPTGIIESVMHTPMDFRNPEVIGARIDEPFSQLELCGGYDHNWVINGNMGELRPAARLFSPRTGIIMDVETTCPGVQFYAGNYLDGCPAGKGGAVYGRRDGVALETQFFPDTPNHANFPACVLLPGEVWQNQTLFRFSLQE